MNVILQNGSTVSCNDQIFNSGADGEMHLTADGKSLVKLYHNPEPWRPASLDAILERFNVVKGNYAHYWEPLLCWPTAIVKSPRLGVVVPLADKGLKKMVNSIVPKWLKYHPDDLGNFSGRLGAAIKLSRAVRRLHNRGLCHSDLSENNLLMNAADGRAYVIDIDGLVVPDLPYAKAVVDGSKNVMAPEIEMGAMPGPSVKTERHTLAVLIYELLLVRHPLLGRKILDKDPDRNEKLQLGARALFVEHPTDRSNPPLQLDYRWCPQDYSGALLGAEVNKLLRRAFVEHLFHPDQRPLPSDWERDLVHLADTLVPCLNPKCVMKSFPLPDLRSRPIAIRCPWCGTPFRGFELPVLRWLTPVPGQPGAYREDGTRKIAWPEQTLHQWHVRRNTLPGPEIADTPLAYFHRSDQNGVTRWFLVNSGLPFFDAADPQGAWKAVRSNEAVELKDRRKLRFGVDSLGRDASVEILTLT